MAIYTKEEQFKLIRESHKGWEHLKNIDNQYEEVCVEAIEQNAFAIDYVKNTIHKRPSNLNTTYYNEYKRRYGVTLDSSLYDVHHIKPLAYGGDNSFSNLIHLPKSIHKTVTSWFSGY